MTCLGLGATHAGEAPGQSSALLCLRSASGYEVPYLLRAEKTAQLCCMGRRKTHVEQRAGVLTLFSMVNGRGQVETESDDASVRTFRSMQPVVTFGFDLTPSTQELPDRWADLGFEPHEEHLGPEADRRLNLRLGRRLG